LQRLIGRRAAVSANRGEIMTRLLLAAEKRNGFLPNLLRILANAPVALETYLTVSGINARSSLSIAERETVLITAAARAFHRGSHRHARPRRRHRI
jgi:hypothetical protein